MCVGKLEDVLDMSTMSSQVSEFLHLLFRTRELHKIIIIARHNICWRFSGDLAPHNSVFSFYDLSQVNNSFSFMRMGSNYFRWVTFYGMNDLKKQVEARKLHRFTVVTLPLIVPHFPMQLSISQVASKEEGEEAT